MKLNRPLSPPLTLIERDLFGVSPELIEAVERGETSPAIAEAVRRSPEWAERAAALPPLAPDALDTHPPRLPDHLRALIEHRLAARAALEREAEPIPAAGQIVELRQIRTPRPGQLDWVMQVPLYVLLDAQAETQTLWHGWLVGGEADYAGWWDFVVQEEDGPVEPEAAVVQLWNPVRLYLPMAERIVGRLKPARLQAVRALAAEYVTGTIPAEVPVWPGRVAQRLTLGGLSVVTGSPLGGNDDPRRRYQYLYFHAAEAVREPARLALAERVTAPATSLIAALLQRWLAGAAPLAAPLTLAPRVALAMSEQDDKASEQDLLWEGLARITVHELASDGAGRAQVSAVSERPVTCEVRVAGILEFKQTAQLHQAPVQIEWEADENPTLTLSVADGRRLELSLVEAD